VHVSAAEPVDRLLRVADEEQLAWNGIHVMPARLTRILRRQEQEQLRLQRIGVLEFVHEETSETGLKVISYRRVFANEVACVQQQVEEIERALSGLEPLIPIDTLEEFVVQECRQIGVGAQLELVERLHQQIPCLEHTRTRDAFRICRSAALPAPLEVAIAPEIDELRFEAVIVGGGLRR
jgi:hypothetical protein